VEIQEPVLEPEIQEEEEEEYVAPKKRGRPKAAPKPKAVPKKRGRPAQNIEKPVSAPIFEQPQIDMDSLTRALVGHLASEKRHAKNARIENWSGFF
jgi:hypothetical protein